MVTTVEDNLVTTRQGDKLKKFQRTILWAAGVKVAMERFGKRAGAQLDRVGRVVVEPDQVPGHPNIL